MESPVALKVGELVGDVTCKISRLEADVVEPADTVDVFLLQAKIIEPIPSAVGSEDEGDCQLPSPRK